MFWLVVLALALGIGIGYAAGFVAGDAAVRRELAEPTRWMFGREER